MSNVTATMTTTQAFITLRVTGTPEQVWPLVNEAATRDGYAKTTVSGQL